MPARQKPNTSPDRTSAPAFSVRTWPFYWLVRADTRYLDSMSALLENAGFDVASWRVLMALREDNWLSVSDIASLANSKLSTMTKTMQRMQMDGLVECREGEADRRVTEVNLTAKGLAASEIARETASRVYERAFRGISERQREVLTNLLKQVANNLA